MPRRNDAARRLRPIFIGAGVLLVLLLAVFAYALAGSQSQQRDDLEKRFNDRAAVAASVNESIFSLATSQTQQLDSAAFGGAKVNPLALKRRVTQQQAPYALVVSPDGTVLASAGKVPPSKDRQALITKAIKAKRAEYSSLFTGPNGVAYLEGATAFPTQYGTRVDVSGTRGDLLGDFLGGFLAKLPNVANAKSYVIDEMGKVIATPGVKSKAGAELPDKALEAAVAKGDHGSYGDRYFTSSPIAGTPWRIVLAADRSDLYSSVETTVPWLIFAAFVLVSAGGLILVRRVLLANAELERADISRQHALEINDNVVQRLVLAKYALDRGATATSQQKLSETLRETQQLVTSMLEEKEIGPGSLRREVPAETDGPPEPPPPAWQKR